jgi:hypothetical protein
MSYKERLAKYRAWSDEIYAEANKIPKKNNIHEIKPKSALEAFKQRFGERDITNANRWRKLLQEQQIQIAKTISGSDERKEAVQLHNKIKEQLDNVIWTYGK